MLWCSNSRSTEQPSTFTYIISLITAVAKTARSSLSDCRSRTERFGLVIRKHSRFRFPYMLHTTTTAPRGRLFERSNTEAGMRSCPLPPDF